MRKYYHKLIPLAGKLEHAGFSVAAFMELFHVNSLAIPTFAGLLIFGVLACTGDWIND